MMITHLTVSNLNDDNSFDLLFWLCYIDEVEQADFTAVENLLAGFIPYLPQEAQEEVEEYLEHAEYGLAADVVKTFLGDKNIDEFLEELFEED